MSPRTGNTNKTSIYIYTPYSAGQCLTTSAQDQVCVNAHIAKHLYQYGLNLSLWDFVVTSKLCHSATEKFSSVVFVD